MFTALSRAKFILQKFIVNHSPVFLFFFSFFSINVDYRKLKLFHARLHVGILTYRNAIHDADIEESKGNRDN